MPTRSQLFQSLPPVPLAHLSRPHQRLTAVLLPVLAGLLLDGVDFASLGPIGAIVGLPLGAALGWWLASLYGLSRGARLGFAILAGLYCILPLTELLPVATALTTLVSLAGGGESREPRGE